MIKTRPAGPDTVPKINDFATMVNLEEPDGCGQVFVDDAMISKLAMVPSLLEVRRVLGAGVVSAILGAFKLVLHPLSEGAYDENALKGASYVDVLGISPALVFAALELARRKVLTSLGSQEALALISTKIESSWTSSANEICTESKLT